MPYVSKQTRIEIDAGQPFVSSGELNYAITQLCNRFINDRGIKSYGAYNEVIGALECAKQEFYRRVLSPYEDVKCAENGDVYE